MSGFLPDESVRNKENDTPWMKSDTDKMLDLYFAGEASPKRIAQQMGRNPKAINRQLELFRYNEKDRAVRYQPLRRISRKGKRFTENEMELIRTHQERNVPPSATACVLARDVSEVDGSPARDKVLVSGQKMIPTIDLIYAYRYLWKRMNRKLISDKTYDEMVAEEVEYGGGGPAFAAMKKDEDFPGRIRSLANYLLMTVTESREDNTP